MRAVRYPLLPRLRVRLRRDGRSSASSPTTRARPSARCSPSASSLAAALFWALVVATGAARRLRTLLRGATSPSPSGSAPSATAPGRCYFAALQRLDASLLVAAALHVPGDGHGRRDRARARARRAGARLGGARARLGRPRPRRSPGAGRGRARSASERCSGSLPPSSTAPTSSPRPASPTASAPLVLSALVCTGGAATLTLAGRRAAICTRAPSARTGFGWLAAIAVVSTVAAVTLFFAGLGASARRPPRSSRPPSR